MADGSKYLRANIQRSYTIPMWETYESHLDFFDIRLQQLMGSIKNSIPYQYRGIEHITNISYHYYNTVELWWVILMFNGIIHPLDLDGGMVLQIPDIKNIDKFIADVKSLSYNSNKSVVTI